MVLRELLDRDKFQYLKVLNDNPDLSRKVITVESTETPDVAKYIPQNTLLIMTGMAFKDSPEQMCKFLEDLDERRCAGLAVKLGRFLDTLDESVIHAANRLGLPLLQIPMDKTLGNVYQELLSYIWDNQNGYLLEALNAQQKISNLILQGSSLKSIMNNIAMIFNKPVMVMDLFGSVLAYGSTFTREAREKAVELVAREKEIDRIPYVLFTQGDKRYCVYPIHGVGRSTHFIILMDFDPREREEQVLIMEQIVMALEMYFYRELYVKYNEMKLREEFMTLFLEQMERKMWSEQQILAIGENYGLKRISEYRIVFLQMEQSEGRKFNTVNFSKKEEWYILIYDWMNHMLNEGNEILIFPQKSNWRYVCLIQSRKDDYLKMLLRVHDMVKEKFDMELTIAQGGIVSSLLNIESSYSQAEQCLIDGNRDADCPYLLSYKPQNMKELFKYIPEKEVKDTCKFTLKELAYPRNQTEEELRKTLYTYLFCGNSITKTAETLFVHRNTIKYRLKKCEEILETDLSEVSDCFQLQLALVLTEYAQ